MDKKDRNYCPRFKVIDFHCSIFISTIRFAWTWLGRLKRMSTYSAFYKFCVKSSAPKMMLVLLDHED